MRADERPATPPRVTGLSETRAATKQVNRLNAQGKADRAAGPLPHIAAALGHTFVSNHEPSFWLRSRAEDLPTRGRSGQLRPCPHLWPGAPGYAVLWAPDRIVCPACLPTVSVTGDADRTCDRCAVVADLAPAMVAAGPALLVVFGLCAACIAREAGQ